MAEMTGARSLAVGLSERALLDAVNVAVVATDLQGQIFYCNSAAELLYGYPREELVGGNVADLLVTPENQMASADIMDAVLAGRSWSGVFPVKRADGSTTTVKITDSPLWQDGEVVGVLGVAEDMTELREALAGEQQAQHRLAQIAAVALELAVAQTLTDLRRIVVSRGLPVLGANRGVISVRDDELGIVRVAASDQDGKDVHVVHAELPLDYALPAAYVARTGETVLLPSRSSGLAWSPLMQQVHDTYGCIAWAALPLRLDGRLLGSLGVGWTDERTFDSHDLRLLEVFATQTAQALHRILATERRKQSARDAQQLSEALQHALLTRPPQPEHLTVAVRYRPAVDSVSIGGDWWDTFQTAGGDTMLVVGDVSGHDRDAAAAMGQLRNLLRGLAYDSRDSPARILSRLDAAVRGLGLDILATAFVGCLEQVPDKTGRVTGRLQWSSAGHLPPVLRHPDATVQVLTAAADLMLGVDPHTDRTDHTVDLTAGSMLLAYTDGLIERRQASLDDGLSWLSDTLTRHADADAEQLCDLLLAQTADSAQEDDVALLAVQV